jgi:hypothetical protein
VTHPLIAETFRIHSGGTEYQMTERYLGSEQEIAVAVYDNLGL